MVGESTDFNNLFKRGLAEFRRRKRAWVKQLFPAFQHLGYHLAPVHFYEPTPDTRELKESLWTERSELIGIDMNEAGQLAYLNRYIAKYKREYDIFQRNKTAVPYEYTFDNPSFTAVDAEILYCMIRDLKPKRIFEIGSGNSTYLAAKAVLKNKEEGLECELVSIEPYPNRVLKKGFPGLSSLKMVKAEDIPLSEFDKLGENDILFIDSSHVLRIGNDVQRLYLEVLPRLKPGVFIHVHDIFLPAEYPRRWVMENYIFWTEQYLLQAFLTNNSQFEVIWGGSYMHLRHSDKLAKAFKSYDSKHSWPGSFWMRRIP